MNTLDFFVVFVLTIFATVTVGAWRAGLRRGRDEGYVHGAQAGYLRGRRDERKETQNPQP